MCLPNSAGSQAHWVQIPSHPPRYQLRKAVGAVPAQRRVQAHGYLAWGMGVSLNCLAWCFYPPTLICAPHGSPGHSQQSKKVRIMLCGNLGSASSFTHFKKLVSKWSYFRVEEKHSHFIPHMVLLRQSSYHANTTCIQINCWARACPVSATQPYPGLCGFWRQRFLGQAARAQRALGCWCDSLLALCSA